MRPRLVATDLDGTLLDSAESVTPRSRATLAAVEALGVPVVFVTARPLRWMEHLWPLVGLAGVGIVSNGAIVYDVGAGRVREVTGLDRESGLALAEAIATRVPGAAFAVETVEGIRLDPGYDDSAHPSPPGTPRGELARVWDLPAVKLLVTAPQVAPEELRAGVLAACADEATPATATWTMDGLMEVSAHGVTKHDTLARVAAELGVTAADVVAFGDSATDLGMLRWAGTSYAMASGHPDARDAADHVAPGCDEDGVARVLEELFGVSPGPVPSP